MDPMFIPITKIDIERHEVWGWGAVEEKDNSDEIMDYASSKPHWMEWSNRAQKRSGGKSLGNVRAMHQNIAVGKLIDLRADDNAKGFWLGAKIVDEEEWKKVEAGVYTGFSVGGSYEGRWMDMNIPGATRYTAKPTEISIVDAPCIPSATFQVIKADGIEERHFNPGNSGVVLKFEDTGELEKWDESEHPRADDGKFGSGGGGGGKKAEAKEDPHEKGLMHAGGHLVSTGKTNKDLADIQTSLKTHAANPDKKAGFKGFVDEQRSKGRGSPELDEIEGHVNQGHIARRDPETNKDYWDTGEASAAKAPGFKAGQRIKFKVEEKPGENDIPHTIKEMRGDRALIESHVPNMEIHPTSVVSLDDIDLHESEKGPAPKAKSSMAWSPGDHGAKTTDEDNGPITGPESEGDQKATRMKQKQDVWDADNKDYQNKVRAAQRPQSRSAPGEKDSPEPKDEVVEAPKGWTSTGKRSYMRSQGDREARVLHNDPFHEGKSEVITNKGGIDGKHYDMNYFDDRDEAHAFAEAHLAGKAKKIDEGGDLTLDEKFELMKSLAISIVEDVENLQKAELPAAPEGIAAIQLEGKVGGSVEVEHMPEPSTTMALEMNSTPSQAELANHTVVTKDLTPVLDSWLAKVGLMLKAQLAEAIELSKSDSSTPAGPMIAVRSRNIKVIRKEI